MRNKIGFVGKFVVAPFLLVLLVVTSVSVQGVVDPQVEVVKTYDADELPEGIAFDKKGNLYVSINSLGQLRKISPDGTESTLLDLGVPGAFGLAVDASGNVYMIHSSGVYRVAKNGALEPLPGTDTLVFPNALAFDKRGNLYLTDSAEGDIYRIPRDGVAQLWLHHELLEGLGGLPYPYPPIGANGIAYWRGSLYVANTEKGHIVQIPILKGGIAGEPEIIANGPELYGLDGIALDMHGNIYAALVLQDKLVKIDPTDGQVTEILTVDDNLDEPASLAFGTGKGDRKSIFITNFAVMPEDGGFGPAILKIDIDVPGAPLP